MNNYPLWRAVWRVPRRLGRTWARYPCLTTVAALYGIHVLREMGRGLWVAFGEVRLRAMTFQHHRASFLRLSAFIYLAGRT